MLLLQLSTVGRYPRVDLHRPCTGCNDIAGDPDLNAILDWFDGRALAVLTVTFGTGWATHPHKHIVLGWTAWEDNASTSPRWSKSQPACLFYNLLVIKLQFWAYEPEPRVINDDPEDVQSDVVTQQAACWLVLWSDSEWFPCRLVIFTRSWMISSLLSISSYKKIDAGLHGADPGDGVLAETRGHTSGWDVTQHLSMSGSHVAAFHCVFVCSPVWVQSDEELSSKLNTLIWVLVVSVVCSLLTFRRLFILSFSPSVVSLSGGR